MTPASMILPNAWKVEDAANMPRHDSRHLLKFLKQHPGIDLRYVALALQFVWDDHGLGSSLAFRVLDQDGDLDGMHYPDGDDTGALNESSLSLASNGEPELTAGQVFIRGAETGLDTAWARITFSSAISTSRYFGDITTLLDCFQRELYPSGCVRIYLDGVVAVLSKKGDDA